MLKVFLVEDEAIIREGLRDIIPWQQYGYTFVGEAADGEQALPLIRGTQPDVLITDIRMPFMDGLVLSRLVSREFPGTKIIIISGYDDFEYARQALRIGVEQYLLKPVTKAMLIRTLVEVREKIQSEREQKDYVLMQALKLREQESKNRYRSMISEALAFIDSHYADDTLSLGDVADHIKVSMSYLSTVFSQETGQTFVEYLTQKRMERAKELLRGTNKRTAEIAAETGYRDPHYFSAVFRKTQGCTPRDYRMGGKQG